MFKKIILGLTGALLLFTPAMAQERTDCKATMTQLVESLTGVADGNVTEISPEEQSAIIEKKGPPPVTPPFTFALAVGAGSGMLVIHDKECIMQVVGPAPLEVVNKFLGRLQAGNRDGDNG